MTTTFIYYRSGSSASFHDSEAPAGIPSVTFNVTLTVDADGCTAYRVTGADDSAASPGTIHASRSAISIAANNAAREYLRVTNRPAVAISYVWNLTEPEGFRTPPFIDRTPTVMAVDKGQTVKLYGRWLDPANAWSTQPGRGMIATTFLAIEPLTLEVNDNGHIANDVDWLIEYGWLKPANGTVPTYIAA